MSPSPLEKFRAQIAGLLDVPTANVEVFSVLEATGTERAVDVEFAAHGSPYYSEARLNGLVLENREEVS